MPTSDAGDKVTREHRARFVMHHVDESDKARDEFVPIWEESLANYMVQPWQSGGMGGRANQLVQYPYYTGRQGTASAQRETVLKDPESHQVVETLVSEVWGAIFSVPDFIRCRRTGTEDILAAETCNRIIKRVLRKEGHTRTFQNWSRDGFIFGTGLIGGEWLYKEIYRTVREIAVEYGVEVPKERTEYVASYDDVYFNGIDIMDFYPDLGHDRICKMRGAAVRFTMTAHEARQASLRPGWNKAAVEKAIERRMSEDARKKKDNWKEGVDRPTYNETNPDFIPLIGYEYWGEVPWNVAGDPSRRRVLTVMAGELVAERPFLYYTSRLPFFELTPNTLQGRFYGVSPLEINRYTQDFSDAILMNIADGVSRSTYAQPIVDRNAGVDLAKLRRRSPDIPILVDRLEGSIDYLKYNPLTQPAMQFYFAMKQQMRESSGALAALQGLGLGVDRASATEAQGTFNQAKGRPEMIAELIEREYLPPIGRFAIDLYSQFVTDPDELAERIGEQPGSTLLSDMTGEYDVDFIGSRLEHNKATYLATLENFVRVWGASPAAALLPWDELIRLHARKADLYEVEALVGDPDRVRMNLALQQLSGPNAAGGNGNGEQPALSDASLLPAQSSGSEAAF